MPRGAPSRALLPRLNAVRAVVDSANRYQRRHALGDALGAVSGASVGNAARDAYLRELDGMLLPRVAARSSNGWSSIAPSPRSSTSTEGVPDARRAAASRQGAPAVVADLEWNDADNGRSASAGIASRRTSRACSSTATRCGRWRSIPSLVAQARSTHPAGVDPADHLRPAASAATRTTARARVRLDIAAGVGGEQVHPAQERRAVWPSRFPASTARRCSRRVTGVACRAISSKQFAADDWVWGEAARSPAIRCGLRREVTELYERDYINAWDALLERPRARAVLDVGTDSRGAGILSAPRRRCAASCRRSPTTPIGRCRRRRRQPAASSAAPTGKKISEGVGKVLNDSSSRLPGVSSRRRAGHARHRALPADPSADGGRAG